MENFVWLTSIGTFGCVSIYIVGFFICFIVLTRHWFKEFGKEDNEILNAAGWAFIGSMLWFIILPIWGLAWIVRRFA